MLLLERDAAHGCSYIYDLDSTLPFPCEAETYISQAIRMEDSFKPKFRRSIRLPCAQKQGFLIVRCAIEQKVSSDSC